MKRDPPPLVRPVSDADVICIVQLQSGDPHLGGSRAQQVGAKVMLTRVRAFGFLTQWWRGHVIPALKVFFRAVNHDR